MGTSIRAELLPEQPAAVADDRVAEASTTPPEQAPAGPVVLGDQDAPACAAGMCL